MFVIHTHSLLRLSCCSNSHSCSGKICLHGQFHHHLRLYCRTLPHHSQVSECFLAIVQIISCLLLIGWNGHDSCCYMLHDCALRQNGVGVNSMFARVGGMLAPLIRLTALYHYTLPMLIYGVIPIAAGGVTLLLPETLNAELQDHPEVR